MPPKPLTIAAVLAASQAKDAELQALTPLFSRLADSLSQTAKSLTPKPVKFAFDGFDMSRAKASAKLPADPVLSCQVRASAWNSALTLAFDRSLVFAFTEAMFGGSGDEAPAAEERPHSHIEKRIAKEIHSAVIRAMRTSFQAVAETELSVADATQSNASLNQEAMPPPELYVRFLAHLWGHSGELLLGLPKSVVLMLQDKVRAPSAPAEAPRPSAWNGSIRHQISDADVTLAAVLSEADLPLDSLAHLKAGQVIKLPAKLGEPVMLVSDGEPVFTCALGQSQGRYVLSIEGPIDDR
jgi:flagellar motor switch protein FliM